MAKKLTTEEVREAYYELPEIERICTGLKPAHTCHLCETDFPPTLDDSYPVSSPVVIWPCGHFVVLGGGPVDPVEDSLSVPVCSECVSNHTIVVSGDDFAIWKRCCDIIGGIDELLEPPDIDFLLLAEIDEIEQQWDKFHEMVLLGEHYDGGKSW